MRITLCALMSVGFSIVTSSVTHAEPLDVPIIERSSDGLDTCGLAEVHGLKVGGDGFLAVRSGPGTKYRKIDELRNGNQIWVFETRGNWQGIIYGRDLVECSPVSEDRILPHEGEKGWVHGKWVRGLAG